MQEYLSNKKANTSELELSVPELHVELREWRRDREGRRNDEREEFHSIDGHGTPSCSDMPGFRF